ncbi:MAG: M28 family peptidase [Victivallaceae bacterium]
MLKKILLLIVTVALSGCLKHAPKTSPCVNADNAYRLTSRLVDFGQRIAGSEENTKQAEFIANTAKSYGATVKITDFSQQTIRGRITFTNIEAELPGVSKDFIVIGSHFDLKNLPGIKFDGANDGASSTGLLLEMIRAVKSSGQTLPLSLRFVFFDGEECISNYDANDGLYGSKHYVAELATRDELKYCRAALILDMIGDSNLNITIPVNSDEHLIAELFKAANNLGYAKNIERHQQTIIDDHEPFTKANIPAIDIIDFDFGPANSYWHTSEDRMANISASSLEIVGNIVLKMIWDGFFQ